MTCDCIATSTIQGKTMLEFASELNDIFKGFMKQYEDQCIQWQGWNIWCQCCKRLKPRIVKHFDRSDYVKIKRHALYYPDHCIHCDPTGIVK